MTFKSPTPKGATSVSPRRYLIVPAMLMALFSWLSSVPGIPMPDGPEAYAMFQWIPPSVQNFAHVPAYAALAWACRWSLGAWTKNDTVATLISLILAAGFGIFDEWHQSFVPYRYASLTDVVLNSVGCILGIWVFHWAASGKRPIGNR